MTSHIRSGFGIAGALALALGATAPGQAQDKGGKVVTFVGCVQPDSTGASASAAASAAAPQAASAPAGPTFKLTNAQAASASGNANAAQKASASAGGAAEYRLVSSSSEDLVPHVNHTVRISGVLGAPPPANAAAKAGAPGDASASASASATSSIPALQVQSLTMVSDSCQ